MPAADEDMHIYLISLHKATEIENQKQVVLCLHQQGRMGLVFTNAARVQVQVIWFCFFFLCCSLQLEHL